MPDQPVRAADFPLRAGGYWRSPVRAHLKWITDLRDWGFAPPVFMPAKGFLRHRTLRGYDPDAVAQFLDALAREAAAAGLRAVPDVPGRQEPRFVSSAANELKTNAAARQQYAQDCQANWQAVSDLPGTHLRRVGNQIIGSHGETHLTRKGREMTLATGDVLRLEHRDQRVIVMAGNGDPILCVRGDHFSRNAGGMVLLRGQRCCTFPVKGTGWPNAVMTAVNESGHTVLWFRQTGRREYDVTMSPQCDLTTGVLCVVELAAGWLSSYFHTEGGG